VYAQTRDGIFAVGTLLLEAKQDLPHGEFIAMIKDQLPFGPRHAQRLMRIAEDPRLTKATYQSHLPACMSTLHDLSKLNDAVFEEMLGKGVINSAMRQKDIAHAVRMQKVKEDKERVSKLVPMRGRFHTLVLDPPWESGGGRGVDYATMTQSELEDPELLPVRDWLEDNAHIYLWVTNGEMQNGYRLLRRWDVEPQTVITWVKPSFTMGHYFRSQTEHVLFATRGKLRTRPAARSIPTYFEAPTTGVHSEKPDAFYSLVRASSYPSYGEVYGRAERTGFTNLFEARHPGASKLRVRIRTPNVPVQALGNSGQQSRVRL
jgi:N6-adenosine-specific RNA methylase IME4